MNSVTRIFKEGALLALFIMLSACGPPIQTIVEDEWYVSVSGNDDNDCRTLATACLSISKTIDKAAAGDTIFIGTGTHTVPFTSDTIAIFATVFIDKPITLQGNGPELTIIDGEGMRNVVKIISTEGSMSGGEVWIRDLTITNGGDGATLGSGGGGVEISLGGDAHVVLMDVYITNNNKRGSGRGGAGIYNDSTLEMYDVVVTDNRMDNTEVHTGQGVGGGIYNAGFLTISGGDISRNSIPAWYGGGIYNASRGEARLFGVTIDSNSSGALGSGIMNWGYMDIRRSTISNNFSNDPDSPAGDGIVNYGHPREGGEYAMLIVNSTISNNEVFGLRVGASTFINHATITENGFGIAGSTLDPFLITNSIIVGNDSWDYEDRLRGMLPNIYSILHNLYGRAAHAPQFGPEVLDAGVLPLGDYGGLTQTHALRPDSVAIDAANDEYCESFDQRDFSRPIFTEEQCDIGAVEFNILDDAETTSLEPTETVELITVTPSQQISIPTIKTDSLCWKGPGNPYEVISSVKQGTQVELLGVGAQDGWLVITNPLYNVPCWLPQDKLDLDPTIDLTALKLFSVPPLPTSTFTPIPQPVAPKAPSSLAANETACNTNDGYVVKLTWKDNATNEDGYRVYRDGNLIATLGSNATQYTDHPPGSGPYSYSVQAFNNAGSANSNTAQEDGCIY